MNFRQTPFSLRRKIGPFDEAPFRFDERRRRKRKAGAETAQFAPGSKKNELPGAKQQLFAPGFHLARQVCFSARECVNL
jgi:hypothetical protein